MVNVFPIARVEDAVAMTRVIVDPTPYTLLRLSDGAVVPEALAARALLLLQAPGDRTVVAPGVDAHLAVAPLARDDGWRRLTLEADTTLEMAGFLAPFAQALAREGVTMLPLAGYRFDHLLVREGDVQRAVALLASVAQGQAPEEESSGA